MVKARECLKEEGIVITNIISALEGEKSDFIQYEYATYQKVFDEVKVFQVHPIEKQTVQNLILIGIKGKSQSNPLKYAEYEKLLENEIKDFKTNQKIATDDYAPIGN